MTDRAEHDFVVDAELDAIRTFADDLLLLGAVLLTVKEAVVMVADNEHEFDIQTVMVYTIIASKEDMSYLRLRHPYIKGELVNL